VETSPTIKEGKKMSETNEDFNIKDHACMTGDCAHTEQSECDQTLREFKWRTDYLEICSLFKDFQCSEQHWAFYLAGRIAGVTEERERVKKEVVEKFDYQFGGTFLMELFPNEGVKDHE
jgi:hypothetical protein